MLRCAAPYKDAQKELTRLLRSTDDGTLLEPTLVTVGAYVTQWLDSTHEQSPKTLERYSQLSRCQIVRVSAGSTYKSFGPSIYSDGTRS